MAACQLVRCSTSTPRLHFDRSWIISCTFDVLLSGLVRSTFVIAYVYFAWLCFEKLWGQKRIKKLVKADGFFLLSRHTFNVTAIDEEWNKSDGASDECLSVGKKTHFKKEKSGPFRAQRLCRFLEQMGYFVPYSISASVRVRMCVWFTDFLCFCHLQLPGLFLSKRVIFVVKDPLMPSFVWVFLFVCAKSFTCVCICSIV